LVVATQQIRFYIGNFGVTGICQRHHYTERPGDTVNLTIATFIVTLLAGLYPAILAARMEPVDALRAEK
jgi:ABC-type lipoprotein release transport system permease subunit